MSALWEVQVATYDALVANSTLMSLISSRIYDEPVTNDVYPYIVVGDVIEINDNRLNNKGFEMDALVRIYTKPGRLGFYESKKILEQVNASLNLVSLPLTNFNMVKCMNIQNSTSKFDDKRSIDARYQIWVSAK